MASSLSCEISEVSNCVNCEDFASFTLACFSDLGLDDDTGKVSCCILVVVSIWKIGYYYCCYYLVSSMSCCGGDSRLGDDIVGGLCYLICEIEFSIEDSRPAVVEAATAI